MNKGITRRTFVSGATVAGALAAMGCSSEIKGGYSGHSELAVATGPDVEKNIKASVGHFGGMEAFVKSGQTVGLLINILGAVPTAHTKPEVIQTVTAMCREAGAKQVSLFDWRDLDRWRQNKLLDVVNELDIDFQHIDLEDPDLWRTVEVPRGKDLKSVRLFNALFEPDVFIMLPLFKHHGGTRFTGALKLYMGATHRQDNRQIFHRERGKYLEQCIADLNTVVRPADLVITDAMEVITSRGPVGPGPTTQPQKIVAGVDRVAIDTYCAPIQSVDPAGSVQIKAAFEHGVGQMDLKKVTVKEIQTG